LVGDKAHGAAGDAAEARDDVLGERLGDFEEVGCPLDLEGLFHADD
jgi:hypothetical protein